MVEGFGTGEHITHIRYVANIPRRKIRIEGIRAKEHPVHRRYLANIPRGDIPIEGTGKVEHLMHIRNATGTGGGCVCLGYFPFGASFGVGDPIYGSCIVHARVRTDYGNPVGMELKVLCVKCELAT